MGTLYYGQAIGRALSDEMKKDENVVIWGEDVAIAGGIFGVTKGLLQEFGSKRVKDTPISELALTGTAVGAAMTGLRPVIEIMFMDFIGFAMDPIFNQAAKICHMFAGQFSVPIVIRTASGGGFNAGPQHSQCLESWFAHVPGVKVVAPSTPADAYGLMISAIRDDNPVLFIEHKALYALKDEVPEDAHLVPIGKAAVVRPGNSLTIIAYSRVVHDALKAAEKLTEIGIDAEIIDLRTIDPWDQDTVLASVAKTNNVLIAHEAVKDFGVGAEISSTIVEKAFDSLDSPIGRVGGPFAPPSVRRPLENEYLVNDQKIFDAASNLLRY